MQDKIKTLLIVDDVELNRALLEELFRKQYRVLEAVNGSEALELYHTYKSEISVVLLDVFMPVLDGFGFLEALNKTGEIQDIPVVIFTADETDQVAIKGYDMGAADIIRKPYNARVIWKRINNLAQLQEYRYSLEQSIQDMSRKLEEQNEKMNQTNTFIIDALCTAVEFRDSESGLHISRIRDVTRNLLEAWGKMDDRYAFSENKLNMICIAAAMHDIGKIAIPDDILKKPGRLTRDEFEVMKTHTVRGCDLLDQLDYVKEGPHYQFCYDICRYHHERFDGKGYPEGLVGDEIPIWAQVVSLADVYDALVSSRVYKPSISHESAAQMILEGGCGKFNPDLLECFIKQKDSLKILYKEPGRPSRFESLKPKAFLKSQSENSDPSERIVRLLELERAKYRILEENTGEIVFDYEVECDTLSLSERFEEVFDCPLQIYDVKDFWSRSSIIHDCDKNLYEEIKEDIRKKKPMVRKRLRLFTKNGEYEWFEILLCSLWDMENGSVCIDLVGKLININEWKKDAEIWHHQASHDSLTGLYNRGAFEALVTEIISQSELQAGVLMFLDLDNFKIVNDTYGHPFGDRVLQHVGNILMGWFRSTDIIGRFGGDEFVIYLRSLSSLEILERKLLQLYEQLAEGYRENNVSVSITASVGIARIPEDGTDYNHLIACADKALYSAKDRGRNCYVLYEKPLEMKEFHSRREE